VQIGAKRQRQEMRRPRSFLCRFSDYLHAFAACQRACAKMPPRLRCAATFDSRRKHAAARMITCFIFLFVRVCAVDACAFTPFAFFPSTFDFIFFRIYHSRPARGYAATSAWLSLCCFSNIFPESSSAAASFFAITFSVISAFRFSPMSCHFIFSTLHLLSFSRRRDYFSSKNSS